MRVLISAYTGLGNFILKTPLIDYINRIFPGAEVDIIAGNSFGAEFVLDGSTLINNIYILKDDSSLFHKVKFFYQLRKRKHDVMFLPFDATPAFLIAGTLCLPGKKYMHSTRNINRTFMHKLRNILMGLGLPGFHFVPILAGRHEIDLNYDLFEAYLSKPVSRTYRTFISRNNESVAILEKYSLTINRYIVLQPGAANGAVTAKTWSPNNFFQLINRLKVDYPNLPILLVGDRGDREFIRNTPLNDIGGVVNLLGVTTVSELRDVLAGALVVVAHDSGVMHIANALQVNLVALFGPTDYTRTRPLGENSHILFSDNACLAAMYNFQAGEKELALRYPDYGCMSAISVDDVILELDRIVMGSKCRE